MSTTRFALALLTLSGAAALLPAHAADATTTDTTRAQVIAEYHRALAAGELDFSREFMPQNLVQRPTQLATTPRSASGDQHAASGITATTTR